MRELDIDSTLVFGGRGCAAAEHLLILLLCSSRHSDLQEAPHHDRALQAVGLNCP